MAESIVADWIADFNSLEPQQLRSFAALHAENHELSTAIHTIFNDKSKHQEYLHPICNQLYNFYRSNEADLKCFTLQFIPNLIYVYLNAVTCGEKRDYRCVETLLLCAYNIEVCTENGLLKSVSYRMPVLAQASIYHEEKNLHASDLKRWEDHSNKEISWRSLQQIYKITAQNRMTVMSALMFIFNQQLSLIQKSALYHLCKSSSKLAAQGYTKHGHSYRSSYGNDPINTSSSLISSTTSAPANINKATPRILLSQQLLLEVLNAIYFAMFNEFASAAIQAVEDIHNRACYELFTDVILVTNAIKNSLQANPSGQPSDGPMGISVALTPATTVVTVSKSMITNASFRTKKLPDDIPIQIDGNTPANLSNPSAQSQQQLGSINEELESDSNSAKAQQQISSTTLTTTTMTITAQPNASTQKSGKETKSHKALGGLKKLIDRDKDKDSKDKEEKKEKSEKELSKAASVIKSGLNDTKENMKKLIGKDKQKQASNHHDEIQQQPPSHTSNGELKNSPLVLMKRSSASDAVTSTDGGGTGGGGGANSEVSMLNETKDGTNCNNNGTASHGIISPFDSLNSDSDSEIEHPHHQLSTSSSASVNILMESTNAKNLGNVQVSQV